LITVLSGTLLSPYIFIGVSFYGQSYRTKGPQLRLCGEFALISIAMLSLTFLGVRFGIPATYAFIGYLFVTLALTAALKRWQRTAREVFPWQEHIGYAFWIATLQIFPFLMLGLFQVGDTDAEELSTSLSVILALQAAAAGGAGILWVCYVQRNALLALSFSVAIFLLLPPIATAIVGAPVVLPLTMANLMKIGNFHVERMTLASSACESVGPLLGLHCDSKQRSPISLCNVHVMSRVGGELYIRLASGGENSIGRRKVKRLIFPSADLRAMQVDFTSRYQNVAKIDRYLKENSWQCTPDPTTAHRRATFQANSYLLNDQSKVALQPLIEAAKNSSALIQEISVLGHADAREHNRRDRLSQLRADAVALYVQDELRTYIPDLQITTASAGDSTPIAPSCVGRTDATTCSAPNRRVDVSLISLAKPTSLAEVTK